MMFSLFEELRNINTMTAVLEELEWDEEKLNAFMKELEYMLLASPPNIEKALFWLKNTPWDTFDRQALPPNLFKILENEIRMGEKRFEHRKKMSRLTRLPSSNTPENEWN
jgi:hypothetical protein